MNHPQIENAKSIAMYNPELVSESDEKVTMTEGCLTFPMVFLDVERSKECTFKYTDSEEQTTDNRLNRYVGKNCFTRI